MESKGKRAPRAVGRTEAVVEPVNPVQIPAPAAQVAGAATEPLKPAEILIETAKPAETPVNLLAAAAASALQPNIIPVPAQTPAPSNRPDQLGGDTATAWAQSQAAFARGLEALSAEMAGLALSGMSTVARAATKMLTVKTLADAIEVNAGLTCTSFDTLVGGSAKLSELGVKLATETTQPLLTQLGKSWSNSGFAVSKPA
jgi:hypothetical protein